MRKLFMLSVIALVLPVSTMAQDDDMYFVPTKKNVEKAKANYGMPQNTYYSGSNRSVDEYNRRYSQVMPIDSVGNDIIDFDGTMGAYPDSTGGDYKYTRMMSRWDDYDWKDGYRAGYADGRFGSRWGWGGYYPYYSGWYGGWYDPWYDPWYYGGYGYWGYAGWYDPWYAWGWGYPHYWHGHYWHGGWYPSYGISVGRRVTGTRNHSTAGSGYNYRRYNSIGGNRNTAGSTVNRTNGNVNTDRNYNFGGARNQSTGTYQNTGSSSSRGASFGGGGGARSGGSSGGGGGRFGGGRR